MEKSTTAQADFCFVHFTDTHIMAGGVHPSTQVDTAACLRQVIDVLNALEPRPAFAVIGGDLVSPSWLAPSSMLTPEDYAPSYLLFQTTHRGQPTFVFLHHHPWPLGIPWIDAMGLQNEEELVNVLRQYPDVRWVICGHVHMDHMVQREGLTMLTTPSTCVQVTKLAQERKKALAGPPGFRLVWVKGTEVSTRVIHLHREEVASLV